MILSIRLSDCLCLCASLTFAMVSVVTAKNTKDHSDSFKRVCYYTNWSQYRRDQGKFLPTDIDPHICTHLIFAFAKIDKGVLAPYEWNDLQYPFLYKQFNALKEKNPTLKTLLAVGGWTHGSQPFTEMVTIKASRLKFIQHAIEYLRTHGFDGLDLDWEYPANRGSPEGDRERFTALVQELREAFEKEAKTSNKERLLLSAAVPGGERLTNSGYDVKTLNKYVDFFNLMSYDLHGSWSPIIGHHAPLIGGEKWMEAKGDSLSVEQSVNLWLKLGADPNKLVMGLALYGKTFKLCNKGFEPGDKSCGSANPDTLNYYEIVQKLKSGKYEKKWLENELVPYAYSPSEKLWVGFDDEESITAKVNFAKKKKLAGVMVWAIDGDDFSGKFGSGVKYPMMNAIRNSIEGIKEDSLKQSSNKLNLFLKLTELSEKDKDNVKKTVSIEKESAQVKEDQVLKEASALGQDKTAQSSSDNNSKAIQSSNTALNGETGPNTVPKIKNDSDVLKTDTEMIHKDEMRKKSDIIDLKTDQQSIINAPVVIRIPPAPYSDLDKELFQKPMAVPLHANLLAPKVGASDKKTSPKPEHKQRSITIHNTGAQLRERLKQVHQKFASSQTNLSSNAVSIRPVITIDKPASTERTPVIRKLGQSSRGQPKRNSPLKSSSSVFEPPKETAYQYPTFIKYSPKSSLTSHSLIQQASLAEASDTPWFTDIKAQEMNNPNQPKEKSTSGIKGKPKRRTTYSKPQSMMINAVPFAKSVAQLIEGKKTDEDTQSVDKAKIVASQVANRNPSFGRYVTLHPEELEGWRTTVVAGTDAPEWVSRLMIEKKEPIKETANEDSDNLVSVSIQSIENHKKNSFFDKESSELKADDTSSEQVNENIPSNEGDGGRILAKVTLPYSLNQMKLRRKAARRHYFPTPYKSLSPFASQKEKLSRNYDRIPKISKYSRFNDDEIASIKQSHMKANRKYQMNAKPKRAQQPESALQNSGENKWWDGPTTSKSTATATPASLFDEATVFLRSSEKRKFHYDQQSAGLVQEKRDSKDSGLTLETTTANKKVQTTTDSKTEHEKKNRASEDQSPTKEEDFVNLNSFLQKTTTTQYVTSTRNHEEITTTSPQTSSRGFNLPARSSYKNNKPWWSVTTTTSAPSSGGIKTFKKHKFPNSGRKYHGESINAVHNELMGISDTPVFKGNLDLNKINPDVALKDNLENIKMSKKDVIVDEQTSEKLSLKNEMSEDAQEGKLNETETTSQANKVSDSNLPYETAKPDSQPYHSKLTLKTFKHNPTPEKIYHYRHAPGQSEMEHSHRRINKLAENEIPHKGFSQPPSISSFTPDIRDWTKIRNLLRNSTVVAEIKSKLDEIHRSVTRDLTTEMPTEEPKRNDANGKKSSKWYERKAGSGNDDKVLMSPSVDTEVGQPSNSQSSVVKTNDDDSKVNVDSNSQGVDWLNKSPSNDDKSLSLIRNAKDDASMNKDTEPLISDISNKQIADSDISNKQIADKRQNNDEKALLKTPNTFQDGKSTSNNDVRKRDKAEKVLDDNDRLQWWEKNKKSDSKLSEVIEGKEDSNLVQSNAPVMSGKDANKERYEKYSSLRQMGPRRNKYNMSSAANSRSSVQTSTQEVSTKRFETTSADTRSMTKNSANTLTKYPMKKPSGTREFRDFKRPKNYNGYVVNNIRREGLRKNSAINAYSSRMQQSSQNTNNSQSEVTQFMSNYGMKDPSRKLDSRHLQMNAVPENEPYQPKNTMMIEIVTQPGQTQPYDLMKESVDRVTDKPESSFKYKTVKNTGNFSCPSTFGIYPDTSDCRKFYQCVWYVAFHHMCGRGTAWNQDNRTCDWPKRTDCLLSLEGELVN